MISLQTFPKYNIGKGECLCVVIIVADALIMEAMVLLGFGLLSLYLLSYSYLTVIMDLADFN